MPLVQITIVPKQVGQIWDQILQKMLSDVTQAPISHGFPYQLKKLIPYHYYKSLNIYQASCYHQYSANLCGYHATFNALCCLNMYLNHQSQYNILSGGSFWRFKLKLQKFLLQIKYANRLEDKWPWRQNDIKYGDFQRTYNKICIELFDDFQVFKGDNLNQKQFIYMNATWQFQYGNVVLSQQNRNDLNKKIKIFIQYNNPQKPLIFGIMMGITCHWTYLVAFKYKQTTQYWFFDSHNQNQLQYSQQQILQSVQKFNQQQRINKNKKPLTNFQREKYATLIKDTQISVRLLIQCLENKDSIDKYVYNQLVNVFMNGIESAVESKNNEIIKLTIKDYWYNIYAFFKVNIKWELLSQQSIKRIKLLFNIAEQLRKQSQEIKNLYELLKKHTIPKGLF